MAQIPLQEKKHPLGLSLQYLKGVGPERFRVFQRLGIRTLEEMMHLFPRRYEDRREITPLGELTPDSVQSCRGKVVQKKLIFTRRRTQIFRLVLEDRQTRCLAIWFKSPYLDKTFQINQYVTLHGRVEKNGGHCQFIHPDYEIEGLTDGRRIHTGRIVPIYPLTQDLNQRAVRSMQYELLVRHLRDLEDPLPSGIRERLKLDNKLFAIKAIHYPKDHDEIDRAYRRLVFEEFFMIQLNVIRQRRKREKRFRYESGDKIHPAWRDEFTAALPFELTPGQKNAMNDIVKDLGKKEPMNRLLQGDVGSGKTTVAAFALYATVKSGRQGVLMAPTEILAQQHYLTLSRMLSAEGMPVALLTQGQSKEEKTRILSSLASGEPQVVVGTHALIQEGVQFRNMRMVVIDEQHKFGVTQRKYLQQKSDVPNLLVMSATPIPRTLTMTLYGELDLSTMSEAPKGRGRIQTIWVGEDKRQSIYQLLLEELKEGRQAYVVHPLVQKSEKSTLKDAESACARFKEAFPAYQAGLLHGQMKTDEKARVMAAFKANQYQILVATSVIEVGIDVANATFLIIEDADRFGLSQLHQLRGRVGRGKHASTCILISDIDNPLVVHRLRTFTQLESGFELAEEDLKLRGPGDFFGSRQHGIPEIRIGDLIKDISILEKAREAAIEILDIDPPLRAKEHETLRRVLERRFRLS